LFFQYINKPQLLEHPSNCYLKYLDIKNNIFGKNYVLKDCHICRFLTQSNAPQFCKHPLDSGLKWFWSQNNWCFDRWT